MNWHLRRTVLVALATTLTGCATFSPDGGMNDVRQLAEDRIGPPARAVAMTADPGAVRAAVDALLAKPLTMDTSVEIALLNNPGLQARLAGLGVAEADLVQAGRLRNPVFAYSNKRNADVTQIDRTLLVNVAQLIFMPLQIEFEQRRFAQAKVAAAEDIVATAAATRQAFVRAVAAQEMLKYYAQVKESAAVSSDLARKMVQAGNWSALAQMREQAFYADAAAQYARARQAMVAEREQLVRLLGLSESAQLTLPTRLPELPATPLEPSDAERTAMERRLDVRMARLDTEAVASSLGLTKATRFINVLEVGYTNESETGDSRKNGYEIELQLPLFDWGDARVARAEIQYRQALARASAIALKARSEVRESYAAYRTAYDLAKQYRDEIVPLRRRIADEQVLRYNGMQIGVFELLADAREQVNTVNAAIEAARDYWLAETSLQLALAGKSPGNSMMPSRGAAPTSAPAAAH